MPSAPGNIHRQRQAHLILFRTPHDPINHDAFVKHVDNSNDDDTDISRPLYRLYHVPVLTTDIVDLDGLIAVVRQGPQRQFSALVFTSARAVQSWIRAFSSQSITDELRQQWATLPCFVVGPATRDALAIGCPLLASSIVDGSQDDSLPRTGSSERLADFILSQLPSQDDITSPSSTTSHPLGQEETRSLPLLYLVGDKTKDTISRQLAAAGISVHERQVYATTPSLKIEDSLRTALADVASLASDDDSLWLVFFSPSGARVGINAFKAVGGALPATKALPSTSLASSSSSPSPSVNPNSPPLHQVPPLLPRLLLTPQISAIGGSTASFLAEHEKLLVAAVAAQPTPRHLLHAIKIS